MEVSAKAVATAKSPHHTLEPQSKGTLSVHSDPVEG